MTTKPAQTAPQPAPGPTTPTPSAPAALKRLASLDWPALATFALAAALVIYLSLENGGYDPIPRGQIGILVWWAVLLGVATQALPVPGRTKASLTVLALMAAFTVWTALSLSWTESAERTATELSRCATYLGVLVLGICLVTRRRANARHVLHGVTFGLAAIAAIGVLSRFQMAWFPVNEIGTFLPGIEIERRLAYPLNYSSAMGALAGMTMPLLIAATASARTLAAQVLSAAAFPLAGLALYLATSGTGAAVAAVALLAFFALVPDRLPKLLTLATGAGGAAILAAAVHSREALSRGLPTSAAEQQGDEMVWIALAVCAAVALAQATISLTVRHIRRPRWMQPSRAQALIATGAVMVVAIPLALAAGATNEASDRWETFKDRSGSTEASSAESILDFSGSGRYQFWESAVDANETARLTGIGPGTFEFWWARNGVYTGFVRDAHSLYMENLAELGVIGLLLIASFVFSVIGIGSIRSLRAPPEQRLPIAAATAGVAGFAMAAALDWVWELAILPAVFMLLTTVAVSGYSMREPSQRRRRNKRRRQNRVQRVGVAALAVAALVAIWFPLNGAMALRQSQVDAANGDLNAALQHARDAAGAQSYAASPRLQEAVILEQQGRLAAAAIAADEARRKESTNLDSWLTLARIQARRNHLDEAARAHHRAEALHPR